MSLRFLLLFVSALVGGFLVGYLWRWVSHRLRVLRDHRGKGGQPNAQ